MNDIWEKSREDGFVISADAPHPTHSHLARTLEWIARVKPKLAVLTNLHIDMDYQTLLRELPEGVVPAHDAMVLEY